MDLIPLNLDLDGSIPCQAQIASRLVESVDLRSEEDHLRLWANPRGVEKLEKTIQLLRARQPMPWLVFVGSGDFHHVTLALLKTLPEKFHPVHVVMIDNHPDWFTTRPRYHCGNWVPGLLDLPWIESVTLAAQDSADLKSRNFSSIPFSALCEGRIKLFPYSRKKIRAFFRRPEKVLGAGKRVKRFYGCDLYFETIAAKGCAAFFSDLAGDLEGKNIYITVDKDCLKEGEAVTDWEQGQLRVEELIDGIKKLKHSGNIVGMDVCGEKAPGPLHGFVKRIDALRLRSKLDRVPKAIQLNQETNMKILEALEIAGVQRCP